MGFGFMVLEQVYKMALLCTVFKKFWVQKVLEEEVCTEDVTGIFNKPQTLLLEKLI